MTTALVTTPDIEAIEQVLINGDLAKLTPVQRVAYYNRVCESLDLNPLTKPFDYINLNGKLVLYAKRDATEQLRSKRNVSVQIVARELVEDCYIVTARAALATGRQDESIGVVSIAGLKGESRANALMKAETKAKRRVTLSICGLGLLDETEVESVPTVGYSVERPPIAAQPALEAPQAVRPGEPETAAAPSVGGTAHPVRSVAYGVTEHGEELPADGLLYVARVDLTQTKNKNVQKAVVTFSDGRQAGTIKTPLITLCQELCQEAVPISLGPDDLKETKWGLDLLGIHRAGRTPTTPARLEPPLEPVECDSIPF